ncbi:PTS mannose transporter subunit IID [Virgibacillus dokdonensis]|uniref:PTS mannose transporter subunit IID n=1 Tax=Virgibacillus dokdonensis TaxID=302167 RepID=A0A3E0WUC4_9BACI|nr:PTS mannose transporter subunit IID [Virgibacillus dokdonensis]RFA36580.1 PTS mannose transporter subunit IID [Virgibacillus dokdonensis]
MATDKITNENKLITKKEIKRSFWRSNLWQGSWNFERMHALGYLFTMIPFFKKLYPENNDERKQAMKRHLEFFNTHPYMAAPIVGVTAAMEEQKKKGASIDDAGINGLKVGMMGPLAGVGDPVWWGTARPVIAALGAGIAMNGNLLGPILFFILWNVLRMGFRYWGIDYGFKKGMDIIKDMDGGLLQKLTVGSSVLGLFIMGALVNKWTTINIPVVVSKIKNPETDKVDVQTVQDILDSLIPGLVPLLLTFFVMWLLRKKVSPITIILGMFVVGILGYWGGILA